MRINSCRSLAQERYYDAVELIDVSSPDVIQGCDAHMWRVDK
jgi:hypothetical protein